MIFHLSEIDFHFLLCVCCLQCWLQRFRAVARQRPSETASGAGGGGECSVSTSSRSGGGSGGNQKAERGDVVRGTLDGRGRDNREVAWRVTSQHRACSVRLLSSPRANYCRCLACVVRALLAHAPDQLGCRKRHKSVSGFASPP